MGEAEQKNNDTSLPTAKITGLEVFASGTHNGDSYSDGDLDAMVAAFDKVGFQPTVKAGHADGQENEKEARRVFGAPALGYVERIYREGHKLLADFKDIPRRFAELIKAGAYKRVSAEIYWQYAKGDTKYPRVLKAVAFLGAEIPALTNLKAIESLYQKNNAGGLFAYDENHNEYRVYDWGVGPMGASGMSMADYLVSVPRKAKSEAGYVDDNNPGSSGKSCANCEYYLANYKSCSLVEGMIDPQDVCDYFEPYEQEGSLDTDQQYARREIDPMSLNVYKSYPWGKCISDNEPKYGKTKAQAICAAIKNRTVHHMLTTGVVKSESEAIEKIAQKIDDDPVYAYAWQRFFEENGENDPDRQIRNNIFIVDKRQSDISVSRDDMREICPDCAEKMQAHGIAAIKLKTYDEGKTYSFPGDINRDVLSELCKKFTIGPAVRSHSIKTACVKAGYATNQNSNNDDSKNYREKNAGGTDMTEEQVNALLKEREESMFKQFEDRIHQAREEGKADANKENELLREDIRKLQLEKRSERIEHWIKGMKEKGKLLPAEESKVRTLRQWLPDEGEGLKYFAVKDGQTKEFSAGPADIFESLFENRQSLFTNYSHADPLNEDDGNELQDPSAEVDRRAKQYQERMAKENKTVSYKDALGYVLKNNAGLAQRYQDRSRPN